MKIVNHTFLTLFIFLFITLIYTQCANKSPVSGGERDTIPPKRIHTNPPHQHTNTHSRVYEFIFDERIKVGNIKKELIITPRIDFEYELKQGKKSFILSFEDDFRDNTTYTFNFKESITDQNESNPTKDNKYTFSTGKYIDSLSIEGHTIDLLKNDTLKEITVGLYKTSDTVNIFNGRPFYFTQSNDSGQYKIQNIKNGKYLIYAFKDNNDNLELETNSEAFAYIGDTIDLNTNIKDLNLYLFNSDIRTFELQTALPSGRNFDVNYNKYIEEYELNPINFNKSVFSKRVKDNKSIRVYNTFQHPDSFQIEITAIDTIGQTLQDSIWVKFRSSQKKPEAISFTTEPSSGKGISETYEANLKFNKPVFKYNPDSILFKYDTFLLTSITKKEQVLRNFNYTNIFLKFNLSKAKVDSLKELTDSLRAEQIRQDSIQQKEEEKEDGIKKSKKQMQSDISKKVQGKGLHLYFGNSAFIGVELDSTERNSLNYKFRNPEDYATINGRISTNYSSYFIQLLTTNWELVDEQHVEDQNKFKFNYINPGKYMIRVLIDENNNGKWDLGNIKKGIEPESVYFYRDPSAQTEEITLRPNWEITDIVLEF